MKSYPLTKPRRRVTSPAGLDALQQLVREAAEYFEACGMDEAADQLLCRAFGDPPDADCDVFGREFIDANTEQR